MNWSWMHVYVAWAFLCGISFVVFLAEWIRKGAVTTSDLSPRVRKICGLINFAIGPIKIVHILTSLPEIGGSLDEAGEAIQFGGVILWSALATLLFFVILFDSGHRESRLTFDPRLVKEMRSSGAYVMLAFCFIPIGFICWIAYQAFFGSGG